MSQIGYNDSTLINLDSTQVGLSMLDKLSRIKSGRRVQPLDQADNIEYHHRYLYDSYNLQIGDTYFMIPPEFIMVSSESTSQSIVTLRQENTQKMKSGYHKRIILIDLVFNGADQINGYKVIGPEGYYYVDGLRQLLAQFKCTPFLPISNELINGMYGIFSVVLQSITISTEPGFPDMLVAQVTLQEVEMFPYLEMPNVTFKYMIDWDLFRYYYQRLLTENHEYKKLQSLPSNKEHNRFKLSILNADVFAGSNKNQDTILKMICDDANYTTWVSSDTSDITISNFQCGYSNLLTNIQLSDCSTPTVQFIGGMDTIYNITFETTDYTVVQAIEQCQITNDVLTRSNTKYRSIGFVKLESELVEFTGSLFVMIETVATNTVPGFPGLYNVQINCVSYDLAQSEREDLNGFLPFDCDKCKENSFQPDHVHDKQTIEQNKKGLETKIKQDNFAEWKLRSSVEVYPDLHLPTYTETNTFISKCNSFRTMNDLSVLPYTSYPTQPSATLHGCNPNNNIKLPTEGIVDTKGIDRSSFEYTGFVDPDFYVFYPCSYSSFEEDANKEEEKYYTTYSPKQRSSFTKTKIVEFHPNIDEAADNPSYVGGTANGNLIEQYIALARSFIGHTYKLGTEGEVSDSKGLMFDCSGLVTYCLKAIGVMPVNQGRYTVSSMYGNSSFIQVPWDSMRRGDMIIAPDRKHVVIYEGDNKIVHASNSAPWPEGGVKESNQYIKPGTVWRPKAFESVSATSGTDKVTSTTGNGNAERIWSFFKSKGISDIGVAGIMGNLQQESGFNPKIVQGTKSRPSYEGDLVRGLGFGIAQWTYHTRQDDLLNWCKSKNVDYHDLDAQLNFMWYEINKGYGSVIPALNNASSVADACGKFQTIYEGAGNPQMGKRLAYSNDAYKKYAGKIGDEYVSSDGGTSEYNLTPAEFDSICRVVMAETKGEPKDAETAMAQIIYDRLTNPEKKFGGLSNILTGADQFKAPFQGELNNTVEAAVKDVFCNNKKKWYNSQAWYFLTPKDTNSSFKSRDEHYDRLGDVGKHTYWGKKERGSDVKYTIGGTPNATGPASDNSVKETNKVEHNALTIHDAERFGEPVFVYTGSVMYEESFWNGGINNGKKNLIAKELNGGINIFNTSFCDEYQYSARGRLVKAFPTYLFSILDDDAAWFDGRKLWTNYYVHRSLVDLNIHATNDMPTETATLVVTNSYHNLDRTQPGLSNYSLKDDKNDNLFLSDQDGYSMFQQAWYKFAGMMPGFGPRLTDKLIKLHQIIYQHAKLREDARVHIRMGYGSDPLGLAPVMNGHVSDIQLGDQISIVVTSDGHELIQHVTSSTEKDDNNGILGLFGLGNDQESSNIIAGIIEARQSWWTHLVHGTFEGSKYSMEHYGLYFRQGVTQLNIADIWNGPQEQYDLLKNIYKANYKRESFLYTTIAGMDGEQNLVFNKYNMTPWDVFQICTQQVPEYIIKSSYHQFDSRIYFGLPFWMEKFRYDYLNGHIYEECKSSTQVHILDSVTNIIDNQVKVTSKFSHTNVKCMYQLGKSAKSTQTIHSDDTIDFSKQKTNILDTPIVQDCLGPDALYEFFKYKVGRGSARRVGISNLLYGWEKQYQGQILCLGSPGIKPHDRLLVNDSFSSLYGVCTVREIVHSFNTNSGFTTSVTPGMIGFSTDENSGLIETSQNFLMILNCFASYIETRRQMRINYEQTLNIFANYEILRDQILGAGGKQALMGVIAAKGIASKGVAVWQSFTMAKHIYNFVKAGKIATTWASGIEKALGVGKTLKDAKGIINTYKAIKTGVTAIAGGATGGIGAIAPIVAFYIIDTLLSQLFEWLENKSVCTLLPMWWENYPFVAGVLRGEKILLMDSNSTSTDENTREEATPNPDSSDGKDIEGNPFTDD